MSHPHALPAARRRPAPSVLTVLPRLRVPSPRFPFVTLVMMILIGGVVGLLLFNTSMQQASFAAAELESRAAVLAEREQTLQMELQELRDPQRLAEAAQAEGMVPARNPGFLRLSDGTLLGEPVPAGAADRLSIDPPPAPRPATAPPAAVVEPAGKPERRADSDRESPD
ncbi:MAG: hypothetical protein ACRCYQ_14500 [Nocardioides sp.]